MYVQQAMHLKLSMPLYYTTRFFQFINTCKEHEKTFVLLPQTLLQIFLKLQLIFTINH